MVGYIRLRKPRLFDDAANGQFAGIAVLMLVLPVFIFGWSLAIVTITALTF